MKFKIIVPVHTKYIFHNLEVCFFSHELTKEGEWDGSAILVVCSIIFKEKEKHFIRNLIFPMKDFSSEDSETKSTVRFLCKET